MRQTWLIPALLAARLLTAEALANEVNAPTSGAENAGERVERLFRENQERFAGNTNVLVRPGLTADRTRRCVTLWARTTGIGANDPIEFFLIGEESGHDYEAIAVSSAGAGDIHEALTFIGVEPGHPVRGNKLEFWPKGERVVARLTCETANPPIGPVRLERLIWNRDTGAPMPETGLVFVGSYRVDAPGLAMDGAYAADVSAPYSIASNYNEPTTVLDVPRRAPQGEVYNFQFLNPGYVLPTQALVTITMEPERPPGQRRVTDLFLDILPGPGASSNGLSAARMTVTGSGGTAFPGANDLNGVLAAFVRLREQDRDPFVVVRFDERLRLTTLRDLCRVLESVDTENGIRIEPPPPGHLYYRAFLPDPSYRNRETRFSQPWELALTRGEDGVRGTLTEIKEIWKDDGSLRPELDVREQAVPTPEVLRETLARRGPGVPVILVLAQADLTYGDVMYYIRPVLDEYPTVHVFIPDRTDG